MRTAERLLRLLGPVEQPCESPPIPISEWRAVEGEAIRHGFSPLLYHRISARDDRTSPPAAVLERLRDAYVHNGLRNAAAHEEIGRILRALGEAGVDTIVLKGAFLAKHVYRDASLRPMLDVDLLVRRPALRRAAEVLGSLGYRSPADAADQFAPAGGYHLAPLLGPGALPVELHWTLIPPSAAAVDLPQIWKSAREVEVAGARTLALSPEHLLHHLCLHVSCHHRFRVPLLQLHDVAAVTRHYVQLDWDLLTAITESHHTRRFVHVVLALVRRAFPDALSSSVLARFSDSGADDAILDTAWECLTGSWIRDLPRFDERLRIDRPAANRITQMRRVLLPHPRQIRSAYGLPPNSPWAYWYYLARPLNFFRRHGWQTIETVLERSSPSSRSRSRSWARLDRWTLGAEVQSS